MSRRSASTFSQGARLGPAFASGAFIGLHGSWNRRPRSGYKVVFVPFANGAPGGQPVAVLSGFLERQGTGDGPARSASQIAPTAPCSSPTMSATRSGG